MARPPKFHFCDIRGYAFPIVVEQLKRHGSPEAIRKLPLRQQGPMMVTLAGDITTAMLDLIVGHLRGHQRKEDLQTLAEYCGGEKYRRLLEKIRALEMRKDQAYRSMCLLGDFGNLLPMGVTLESKQAVEVLRRAIKARTTPSNSYYASIFPEFLNISHRYRTTYAALEKARMLQDQSFKKIQDSDVFRNELQKLQARRRRFSPSGKKKPRSEGMLFTFDVDNSLVKGCAIQYLRGTDPEWWQTVRVAIETQVQKDAATTPAKILLRDPWFVDKIDEAFGNENKIWDAVAGEALGSPEKHFPYGVWPAHKGLTSGALRQWRKTLRDEDDEAMKWVDHQGGCSHPSNVYFRWWDSQNPNSNLRRDPTYSSAVALNELIWCLSRGQSAYQFQGIFSEGESRPNWDKRVASWGRNPPDYREHPRSNS